MLSLIPRLAPWPVPRALPTEAPGPTTLAAGDATLGWYGEVSDAELISGAALATQLALSQGVAINPGANWLKFSHQGRILFVAKKTVRSIIAWNHLNAANLVYGNRVIQIAGRSYKIRLLKGGNADPASTGGGEWNDLIYRVHVNDPTNTNWAAYTDAQLFVGQNGAGSFSWCQEADAQDPSKKTGRGMSSLTHWMRDNPIETNANGANTYQSWRPVLEFIPPVQSEYDPTLFMQYTFSYGEAINEVTETFAALSGNASVSNGRLSTGASASDNMSTPAMLIAPNEDFTLEAMFNCTTHNVNMPILGIVGGSNTGVSKNAWYLHYDAPAAAFRFMVYDGTGASDMVQFARPNIFNADTHIAVARKDGMMTLFIAGQPVASVASVKGNVPTSVQMGTTFTSTYMNGTRSNFRLVRGRSLYDGAFDPPATLPVVGRPTYTAQEAATVKAQIDLRRDSARNDANGRAVQVYSSARHVRGRILHGNSASSFYYTPCEPFGVGDFTIELDFNLSAINGSYGGALAGQWVRGNVASEDNCWLIYVGPTRLVQFAWGRSAAANDFDFIASAANVFEFGADYRLVVERIGTTLTIYLNDVQVAQGTCAIPLRTNAPHYVRSNSSANLYAFGGSVWNLRISDRAVYNGVVTRVPQFPKMPKATEYTESQLSDIVVQVDVNEGNARNSKTGEVITFSGTGSAVRERLVTTLANTSRWYIPCGPFSAGDFTIEFDLNLLSSTGASSRPVFGQFRGDVGPNSWVFYTTSSGNLAFQCLGTDASSLAIDSLNGPVEKRTLTAGKEHHVVVERVAGVITMYIDGVVIGSGAFTSQFVDMSAYPYITNLYDLSTAKYCASEIGNVRIAKRALYNGNISKTRLPLVPNQKPSLTANIGSAIGTLSGACQNLYYGGVQSSLGAFSHTLFRDIRDPQNIKTVRLVALALDRTYTVLAWREVDIPPTADMPQFTNSLKIGNAAPLLISSSSSASVTGGVTGRYWSSNPFGPLTHGTAIPFEFV